MPIIETVPVPDTFVSGVGKVEDLGHGMLRFYFYAVQAGERVVVAKIVMAAAALPVARQFVDQCIARGSEVSPAILALLN